MSSSSEFVAGLNPAVVPPPPPLEDAEVIPFARLHTPELRTGVWTRLGDRSLLGDPITEALLGEVADRARATAEAQGYTVGWAKGKADAEAEIMRNASQRIQDMEAVFDEEEQLRLDEHANAMEALAKAAEEVRTQVAVLAERVETQATELAWAVLETLFGRELALADGPDVIRRVLAVLPQTPLVQVRLHPDTIAGADLGALYDRGVEIVPDTALAPADAMVSSEGSVIDLRMQSAIDRVREVLGS